VMMVMAMGQRSHFKLILGELRRPCQSVSEELPLRAYRNLLWYSSLFNLVYSILARKIDLGK